MLHLRWAKDLHPMKVQVSFLATTSAKRRFPEPELATSSVPRVVWVLPALEEQRQTKLELRVFEKTE